MHRIGEFHLNYAAGLEDSIIKTVAPPWNGARLMPAAPVILLETGAGEENVMELPSSVQANESASTSEVMALEQAGLINAAPTFEVVLGATYYRSGFFNVPVKFSEAFPQHGTEISLYCGDARTLIRATVDRKANQVNHTPRIFGRRSLAT